MKLKLSHASSSWGADMGRPNLLPDDCNAAIKLHLERLKWVDHDYDSGGAYFGGGNGDFIYCAYVKEIRIFVRAKTRVEAKGKVKELLPNARFYR